MDFADNLLWGNQAKLSAIVTLDRVISLDVTATICFNKQNALNNEKVCLTWMIGNYDVVRKRWGIFIGFGIDQHLLIRSQAGQH